MKKFITCIVLLCTIVGLSGLALAAGTGSYKSPGTGSIKLDITTDPHPIGNEVDVTFEHDGESKTLEGQTPNPNGPCSDAWETGEVEFSDGTKFRVNKGRAQYQKPGWTKWTTMKKTGTANQAAQSAEDCNPKDHGTSEQ